MKTNAVICCVALLTLAIPSANVAAQSFGFETPDQGNAGWDYSPDLIGWAWTVDLSGGGGAGLSGPDGPWACDSTSPDPLGDQFAFLQSSASITQTVTGLTVGVDYEVTFYEATRTGFTNNDLNIVIDEGLGSEVTIYSRADVGNSTWEQRTSSIFVPESTSCTLTLSTTNPLTGDRTTIVDGVSVAEHVAEGEGEPEPGIIIASTAFPTIGQPLTLTKPVGALSPYQWYKLDGVEPVAITGATKATLGFPLIGTANYGADSDTVRISSGTYSEDSIAFDGGTDEYLPTSDGGYQVFSGDDDAWTFEATFTSDTGALPEIGVTKIGGGGGYVELYVNFYYEYVYAWAGGGVLSGSYITIDGTEAITVRMEASATEIVCSADSTTTGAVALGNYTRGAETGYRPWLYECYGGDYDFEVSDMSLTGYGIDAVNPAVGLLAEDLGIYALTYDDGAKATAWAYYDLTDPFPVDSEVPLTSLVGLGLLAGAGLVGGMLRNRKK